MAREIKSSNPFLDDDDVDDNAFLNHPKQGQSGYMLGNDSKERNEWEIKRMQLLEDRRRIEERTLQSTNNSLGLLHESEQVGILTAEELLKQREQLQNIDENLDTINNTMRASQKHINSLKSIFGGIKNYFSKGNVSDPVLKPPLEIISSRKPPSQLQDTVGELRTDTKLSEATHPGLRIRDLPYDDDSTDMQVSKSKIRSPTASTRFPNDIDGKIDQNLEKQSLRISDLPYDDDSTDMQVSKSKIHSPTGSTRFPNNIGEKIDKNLEKQSLRISDLPYDDDSTDMQVSKSKIRSPTGSTRFPNDIDEKIDQNLDHLSMGLGRLKNLAIGLNEEMEQQNDMIDAIHNKADKADETLEYQNRQIKRILKK